MKNKRLSVLLSFILVLVLTVSFSVPVLASSVTSDHIDIDTYTNKNNVVYAYKDSAAFQISSNLISDQYYKLNYSLNYSAVLSSNYSSSYINYFNILFRGKYILMNKYQASLIDGVNSGTITGDMIFKGSELMDSSSKIRFMLYLENASNVLVNIDIDYDFIVNSITALSSSDSAEYEAGYNAGYSAGEESGYSSGYSSGYDDGVNSVDQDAIYDQGYQAGVGSVDTESYYDAGYSAGYDAAYSIGYDNGYDSGYDDAMSRIENWGADTSDYPNLLVENSNTDVRLGVTVKTSSPLQYCTFYSWTTSTEFNPSHTYCFYVNLTPRSYTGSNIYYLEEDIFFLNVGGIKYKISDFENASINKFFIPGDRISSAYSFSWEPYCAVYGNTVESSNGYVTFDLDYSIYDYGPSGDTQNHIANQTDQLTNGYDASSIGNSNTALSGSIAEYTGTESQITDQSVSFIDGVQFYDLQTKSQLLTCITFCSSWLQSLFVNIGDWGILVMVSLSLGLGLMLIGWFKYRRK